MSILGIKCIVCFICALFTICQCAIMNIYEKADFKGENLEFQIGYNGVCYDLPPYWEGKTSAVITGEVCVDMYSEKKCTGEKRIRLYPGNNSHSNLSRWNFDNSLKSVQACNRHINQANLHVYGNTVAVWEDRKNQGEFFNLNVDSCENLPEEWRNRISAAGSIEKCNVFYSGLNCTGTYIMMTPHSVGHDDFAAWGFDDRANSVGTCRDPSKEIQSTRFHTPSQIQSTPIRSTTTTFKAPIDDGLRTESVILIIVSSVLIVLLIFILYFFRQREAKPTNVEMEIPTQLLSSNYIESFMKGNPEILNKISPSSVDANYVAQYLPYESDKYEIPWDCLQIDFGCPLGIGEFGIVSKATLTSPKYPASFEVAVKSVKHGAENEYVKAILDELKIMMYLKLKTSQCLHIVNLIGACTQKLYRMEPYIVLEYCKEGSLDKFLMKHRRTFMHVVEGSQLAHLKPETYFCRNDQTLSTREMFQWSKEIADGMEHLARNKVIHGDLATRNILLDEKLRVKISDFGLSKRLYQYSQYVKKKQAPLPWRWMAMESLGGMTFSSQSDVWSFGVTLWEIFTLAEIPYLGVMWGPQFLSSLREGFRLSKPKYASSDVFNTMLSCWKELPEDRPTFGKLHQELCLCLEAATRKIFIAESRSTKCYDDIDFAI